MMIECNDLNVLKPKIKQIVSENTIFTLKKIDFELVQDQIIVQSTLNKVIDIPIELEFKLNIDSDDLIIDYKCKLGIIPITQLVDIIKLVLMNFIEKPECVKFHFGQIILDLDYYEIKIVDAYITDKFIKLEFE